MSTKLTAFMTAYKFRKTDEEKLEMIRKHIKNEYIPYEKKANIANAIADNSYWITEKLDDGTETKKLHVNSVAKYMLTCIAIFDLYTDIERQKNDGKMLEDFNMLNESGVFDLLIQNIDQRELKEFNMIVSMTCDDVIANEFENHAYFSKQIDRFGKLIGTALAPAIAQLDMDQILEAFGRLNK